MVVGILELIVIAGILGAAVVGVVLVVVLGTRRCGTSGADNPNLRQCPDCGRYISVRATTCPQCGGPVKAG